MTGNKRNSFLWQRLREARTRSGLSQLKVSQTLKLTRGAVAMHESGTETVRTTPDSEQVMQYARLYKIPPELLIDDSVRLGDIKFFDPATHATTTMARLPPEERKRVQSGDDPRARVFWGAVQEAVIKRQPELQSSFGVIVERHGVTTAVPFLHGRAVVTFTALNGADRQTLLTREVPALLFLEAVIGKKCTKHLFVLADQGARGDGKVLAEDAFGCIVTQFTRLETAAAQLAVL